MKHILLHRLIQLHLTATLMLLPLSATALEPAWEPYRQAYLKGDCGMILRELEPLGNSSHWHHADFWERSHFLSGKCLVDQQEQEQALEHFLLPQNSPHPDVALFYIILASIEAGKKQFALEQIHKLLEKPEHRYYLKRIRHLLREYYGKLDELELLFSFLRHYRTRPRLFLMDSRLHQFFMVGAETFHEPVSRSVRLQGWLQPDSEESARQTQSKLWPTDFESLTDQEIRLRIKNLQKLNLHEYLIEHLPTISLERNAELRKWLGNAFIEALFEKKFYTRILDYAEREKWTRIWGISKSNLIFWKARIGIKQGQLKKAIQNVESFKKLNPQNKKLPFLYRSLALNFHSKRSYRVSGEWWARLISEFPKHTESIKAHWKLAWFHYSRGRYEEALKHLDAGLSISGKNLKAQSQFLYWKAKLLAQQGLNRKSLALIQQLLSKHPNTYYGLRGLNENGGQILVPIPGKGSGKLSKDAPANMSVQERSLLNRWRFLFDILDNEQAVEEIMETLDAPHSRGFNWEICVILNHYREYHALQRVIANHYIYRLYNQEIGEDPLWEFAYPRPYWELIRQTAFKAGIDPYFALAIMREESHFNPKALSRTEAMGLMQLMPATAREEARRQKIKIKDLDEIFDPHLNMLLGTHYLGKMASRFNDELVYTAGGYNAGPTNMQRWLKTWHNVSPEEFVEHIPFKETRNYIKRVYRTYQIYRQIYSS